MPRGKYISTAVGCSHDDDPATAAAEAVQNAKHDLGAEPSFTIVYIDSRYDPHKANKALTKELGTSNWVGCSTASQHVSGVGYYKGGITAVCLKSDHLHFGVSYKENYKKNATQNGEKVVHEALKQVQIDKQVDPYVQFRRMQTKSFEDIIKTPPYFIISFITGVEVVNGEQLPGYETEFIEGVKNVLGVNCPIVGGAVSSDLDSLLKGKTNLFILADGKVLEHAALTVFVVSNLYFGLNVDHGYVNASRIGLVTKMDKTGHYILEINGKPAMDEYARLLGIDKEEVIKDPFKYTFEHPIGVIKDNDHLYIKEWMPVDDKKSIRVLNKIRENSVISIVDTDIKKTTQTLYYCTTEIDHYIKAKNPALVLIFNCVGRLPLLNDAVKEELKEVTRKYRGVDMVGFHTFGEIGAKHDSPAETVNQSAALIVLYDQLLTE